MLQRIGEFYSDGISGGNKMKIVILDGHGLNPGDISWAGFEALGEVTLYERTPVDDPQEIIHRIGDAQVALSNKVPITEEILAACPNLEYVGVMATGFNQIDLAACAKHQVTVTNIPAYGSEAVAQFTFALLLEITSQVALHNASVKQGDWQRCPDFTYFVKPLMELQEKTIGLIGYGAIAQEVATIAHAFKMKVIYWNHREKTPQADWAQQVSLAELYQKADIISLHVPLFPETEKMIDQEAIEQMKEGAILINTARGPLLDEEAVANALHSGKLSACGLDVVAKEPIEAENPLLTAPNCWLTPHIAWAAVETRERLMAIGVDNLAQYVKGTPRNIVK